MNQSRLLLLCVFFFSFANVHSQPADFHSRGIGGGGALFSPSINPADADEYYLASDLGGLYHTSTGGQAYDVVHFTEAITGIYGKVCFTNDPGLRYSLLWDRDNFATRPAKTTDGGQTWGFLSGDIEPYEDKLFIFTDFENPDRILWTDYNHLFVSNDGGQTSNLVWTALDLGAGILLSGAYFDGQNIWLGTNYGVLHSSDGGASFSLANFTGIPSGEAIIGFGGGKSTTNTLRFYALTGNPDNIWATNPADFYWENIRGVYTMDDLSGAWSLNMNGIDITEDFAVYLSMANNDPKTCYIAGSSPYGEAIVLKTADGGSTWQHIYRRENNQNILTGYQGDGGDLGYSWGGQALGFAVNPLNSQQALLTDLGFVHQTTDGGNLWHQAYLDPTDENPAGQLTPKGKYYHGVGMEQTSVWQVFWFDDQQLFGCFTDIKGIRSEDVGASWSFDYTGHDQNTMYRIAKHNSQLIWFGATSSIHDIYQTTYVTDFRLQPFFKAGKVLYSQDAGKNWQTMRDFENPVIWVTTDPTNNDRLYVGVISTDPTVGGIWRADDLNEPTAATWAKLPNPPANLGRIFNIHALDDGMLVTTWSARKDNFSSVFSDSSGVFVSVDGGMNWERRNHPDMNYWTKDLVIDPFDTTQNTWYACIWSGWGGPANDLGALFRTTDRGLSWEKITGGQQFHRVSSVTVDPNNAETMYLTTEDEGLWVTHNKSAEMPTWELVHSYPFHHPERVFFNPNNPSEMWVASFGNGMRVGLNIIEGTKENLVADKLKIRIFGNPSSEKINLEINSKINEKATVSLFDENGRLVKEFGKLDIIRGKHRVELPIGELRNGLYFIQFNLNGKSIGRAWMKN